MPRNDASTYKNRWFLAIGHEFTTSRPNFLHSHRNSPSHATTHQNTPKSCLQHPKSLLFAPRQQVHHNFSHCHRNSPSDAMTYQNTMKSCLDPPKIATFFLLTQRIHQESPQLHPPTLDFAASCFDLPKHYEVMPSPPKIATFRLLPQVHHELNQLSPLVPKLTETRHNLPKRPGIMP